MQYVKLGRTGLQPSRLGFGCSQIASLSTTHPPAEVRATLSEAFEKGVNFFDTADVYGQGDSERLLGKLFKDRRDKVILCSKAGLTTGVSPTLIRRIKPLANPLFRRWKRARREVTSARLRMEHKRFEPAYLKRQIEASLQRLKTDYLDLFLLHSPPADVLEDEAVFTMLQRLKKAGSIRYYGVSCDTTRQALTAMQRTDISCLQVPVNLLQREMVKSVLPEAQTRDIGIVAREPLAGGAVLYYPAILDMCRDEPAYSPARLAFGYALQQNEASVILAGMSCRRHLRENLKIMVSNPLRAGQIARLDAVTG